MISVRFDFLARNLVPNQKPSDPQINVRSSKNAGDTNLCTNWSSRQSFFSPGKVSGNLIPADSPTTTKFPYLSTRKKVVH